MGKFINITGQTFGRLTALRYIQNSNAKWECVCECGTTTYVVGSDLRNGHTKSCGCLFQEHIKLSPTNRTHGASHSVEYNSWCRLKDRCNNKNNRNYPRYGGRGITVCDRWLNSFENFYEDMGDRPTPKHSLDRIDNNKGYSKENCRWATHQEQSENRRTTNKITYNSVTLTITSWSRRMTIPRTTFFRKIKESSFENVAEKYLKEEYKHQIV